MWNDVFPILSNKVELDVFKSSLKILSTDHVDPTFYLCISQSVTFSIFSTFTCSYSVYLQVIKLSIFTTIDFLFSFNFHLISSYGTVQKLFILRFFVAMDVAQAAYTDTHREIGYCGVLARQNVMSWRVLVDRASFLVTKQMQKTHLFWMLFDSHPYLRFVGWLNTTINACSAWFLVRFVGSFKQYHSMNRNLFKPWNVNEFQKHNS